MPTPAEIQQSSDNPALIRKIQSAFAFLAKTSVALPDSLFAADGSIIDLKTLNWTPIGMVTKDGYSFGRDVNKEDVESMGYASPTRSDITKVARNIKVTGQEYGKRNLLELTFGTDLSGVTMDATTGEVVFDEPDLPVGEEYRLLVIGFDGPADDRWVLGRGYGRVKLASTDDTTWGSSEELKNPISLDVFTDPEIGTPVKHYYGGTGPLKHKAALGFGS